MAFDGRLLGGIGVLAAVVETESRFAPHAVSPCGAVGLMQLLPSTGEDYGAKDLQDPYANVDAGSRYLRVLLDRFRMSAKESDYASSLSGGQKRLLEIMRALMLQPRLLLLDEPMSGVHPSIVGEIADYCEALRVEGLTILMVEHELHIVERMCNPVVVMAQGSVIGQGTMDALRQQREIVDAYLVG